MNSNQHQAVGSPVSGVEMSGRGDQCWNWLILNEHWSFLNHLHCGWGPAQIWPHSYRARLCERQWITVLLKERYMTTNGCILPFNVAQSVAFLMCYNLSLQLLVVLICNRSTNVSANQLWQDLNANRQDFLGSRYLFATELNDKAFIS